MRTRSTAIIASGLAAIGFTPALGQSAASPPALTGEQAIQLAAEAGFPLVDGAPANRCGKRSNPRIAFVDLNADGRAEVHVADVDPACYGKPGAYFAILAQQADGSWKRLIAEDGIVGFARSRTQDWIDLTLDARDSACPGTRRFNGGAYTATGCSVVAVATSSPAEGAAAAPTSLTGSRAEQMAALFRNIVLATRGRDWNGAITAFSGAKWEPRANHPANWAGSTASQNGTIALAGAAYDVRISGTANRVNEIQFDSPPDDLMEWGPIAAALRAAGVEARNIGCHSPTGFGFVRLTVDGHSAILHKSVNYGTAVPSTDIYAFTLDDPFDGRTEAEVAADRSLC